MGAIKDIVDLVKDLESRAKDRKDIDTLRDIISLTQSVQAHDAEVVDRDIRVMQENANLMSENAELKKKLAESQAEDVRIFHATEFRRGQRTGNQWIAFCPKCHIPASLEFTNPICSNGDCHWTGDIEAREIPNIIARL